MSIAIRDFQADDAAGVSALFRAIYGEHYVYPDVYLPSMIRRHNTAGRWHSAVAVSGGRVLGHAALWRDPHCLAAPSWRSTWCIRTRAARAWPPRWAAICVPKASPWA